MLVLSRKKGQSVLVGREIKVVVVEVTGDTVRLGFEAPPELEIFREELYRALQEENAGAVTSARQALKNIFQKR